MTEPYSSVEITVRTGSEERKIVARRVKDVRMRTDRNLDPEMSIHAGGGEVFARYDGDEADVELNFTALLDPETGTILQESRQP
jgi:hypothetical protein